jgi:anti-anti-sigma regulatory factor
MSVEIERDPDRRIAVLVVRGDLTPHTAAAVGDAIAKLVTVDGYDVVVDLTESGTILAGGVRALKNGCELAREHQRDVTLACPRSSPVRPALAVAHMDVTVYDSRAEALARAFV